MPTLLPCAARCQAAKSPPGEGSQSPQGQRGSGWVYEAGEPLGSRGGTCSARPLLPRLRAGSPSLRWERQAAPEMDV